FPPWEGTKMRTLTLSVLASLALTAPSCARNTPAQDYTVQPQVQPGATISEEPAEVGERERLERERRLEQKRLDEEKALREREQRLEQERQRLEKEKEQ